MFSLTSAGSWRRCGSLRLAFGNLAAQRESVFLTKDQIARAEELAGDDVEFGSALITRYVADDHRAAYFDTHRVRTLKETLMVVVTPEGKVERVEILSFLEPREYLPRDAWLEQFQYKPAVDAFREAVAADPRLGMARFNLSLALYHLPDVDAATWCGN